MQHQIRQLPRVLNAQQVQQLGTEGLFIGILADGEHIVVSWNGKMHLMDMPSSLDPTFAARMLHTFCEDEAKVSPLVLSVKQMMKDIPVVMLDILTIIDGGIRPWLFMPPEAIADALTMFTVSTPTVH